MLVGQDDQRIGFDQVGDQGAQGVVVAKFDLVGNDRIVLVDDRDDAEFKQGGERRSGIQVALAVGEIVVGEQQLGGVQAVLVNRPDDTGRLPAVVGDDRLAMKLVVEHLLREGHRRIAHLAGPQHVPTGVARRQGLEQALRDHDLAPAALVECESFTRDAGRSACERLLAQMRDAPADTRADALVCANDLIALGAYDALREAGLRVPQDLSVTGHNDMPMVDLITPPLTTVRLPHREFGWRAAELLFGALDGAADSVSTVVLRPELVVRGSTCARG